MAKQAEFFLVALPGLEDLVQAEVADWFPDLTTKLEHGGVTVKASLEEGLAMNQALKTPTRILLRIASFRCRDFPHLFNAVKKLKWSEWIDPSCDLSINVSTRLSRLKIKARIADTCADAWFENQKEKGFATDFEKKAVLYVRFLNDECTLSLDTSGERLHKRGDRRHIGEAPLRETIAASLIQLVGRHHAGESTEPIEIVDPMLGSGTFLLEAETRDNLVSKREFAFENFAIQPTTMPQLRAQRPQFRGLVGYELDKKSLAAAKTNLKGIQDLHLHSQNFLQAEPLPGEARRWLFANPPYGERLKVKEPLSAFYVRLFAASERVARPERACFLLPAKAVKGKFELPRGWKVLEKRPFVNGGIPVVAFVFGRVRGPA